MRERASGTSVRACNMFEGCSYTRQTNAERTAVRTANMLRVYKREAERERVEECSRQVA